MTHHPSDLNIDHQVVSNLTLAASRLSMRRPELSLNKLKNVMFMEILSSTDWGYPTNVSQFRPNLFFFRNLALSRISLSSPFGISDILMKFFIFNSFPYKLFQSY